MINVKRSPAPSKPFKYNDLDIIERLKNDFYVLCYICEEYVPKHFEIDHFKPQEYFPELKNDWDNLFYCCEKCNNLRSKNINTVGNEVLNNCIDNVEDLISLKYENNQINISINSNDKKAINTKKLLNRIYNGIDTKSKSFRDSRLEVRNEINKFEEIATKYRENKEIYENDLKERLSKRTKTVSSAYVSFKRQIVRERYQEFEKYFD